MSLEALLSSVIPKGVTVGLLHLQRLPEESHPLVLSKKQPESGSIITIKTQHFFILSHNRKVFYALEVFVYLTIDWSANSGERLVFVSKADTNGYCDTKISIKAVTTTILEYLLSISPLLYLSKVKPKTRDLRCYKGIISRTTSQKRALLILSKRFRNSNPGIALISESDMYKRLECAHCQWTTKLCLFTRAEPQYLFADSSKNPRKHLLTGDQLLKWWLSIVDRLACQKFEDTATARLRIPGEDSSYIKKHLCRTKFANWEVGDIFNGKPQDLAAFRIPVFPDDPKARFLEQLVEDTRIKVVRLSTFWAELQAQQEFRLGATVSVIGVCGQLKSSGLVPSKSTAIVVNSKRKFNLIKSYVTGEKYASIEGALDAYMNLCDYLDIMMNEEMTSIEGSQKLLANAQENLGPDKGVKINNLNTMVVRKKIKK